MGPGIVIPIILIMVVIPLGLMWARKRFKEAPSAADDPITPAGRLTSNALRELPTPLWRVIYEIAPDRLGGVEHVLIGPPGVSALVTSMEPMPSELPASPPDARALAAAAIVRGPLDDALRRCAMSSDRLVTIHWGRNPDPPGPLAIDVLPGSTAVDGHRLVEWTAQTAATTERVLTPTQVDLAWQTVVTAIGRPDPLT